MLPIHKLSHLLKTVSHETLAKPVEVATVSPPDYTELAIFRVLVAWLAYFVGSVTLQNVGVFFAIIFTILQIVALLRKEFGLFKPKDPK